MDALKQRLALLSSATDRLKSSAQAALRRAGCQATPYNRILKSTTPSHLLDLPQPHDLLPRLIQRGYSQESAQTRSQSILESARDLSATYQSLYRHACTKIIQEPGPSNYKSKLDKLKADIELQYKNRITAAEAKMLSSNQPAFATEDNSARVAKAAFNESSQLLEEYFGINAFPDASERRSLSEKTTLSEKQIEVWFQNHRTRSRKERRQLKRSNPEAPPSPVNTDRSRSSTPSTRRSESPSIDCEHVRPSTPTQQTATSANLSPNLLDESVAPSINAYPATYRRSPANSLFLTTKSRPTFPPPCWLRSRAISKPNLSPVDMDKLIADFNSKLNFRESVGKRAKSLEDISPPLTQPTRTCSAPLAALVPSPNNSLNASRKPTPLRRLRITRAPKSRRFHPFSPPAPGSAPETLLSAAHKYAQDSFNPDRDFSPLRKRWTKSPSCQKSPLSHTEYDSTSPSSSETIFDTGSIPSSPSSIDSFLQI